MDLLSGYQSSDDDGGAPSQQQPKASTMPFKRAAAPSAPLPSVPVAVLRNKGYVGGGGRGGRGGPPPSLAAGGSSSSAVVAAPNAPKSALGAVQGPSSLHDPSDSTSAFVRAIDAVSGSTSRIEADAGVDEDAFARNRNAFQRGAHANARIGEVALAPGDTTREIARNDYGQARRNYAVLNALADAKAAAAEGDMSVLKSRDFDFERHTVDGQRGVNVTTEEEIARDGNKRRIDVYGAGDGGGPGAGGLSRRQRRRAAREADGPLVHDPDDELAHGVWAPPSASERALAEDAVPMIESGVELDPRIVKERERIAERDRIRGIAESEENEKEKFDRMVERKLSHLLPPRLKEDSEAIEPSTVFHGTEEVDYRGRSWTAPPSGSRPAEPFDTEDHACYVPKKCVHRFTGHEKGVHRIRLSPRTGHLILSAGLDHTCKVWSVEKKCCMRTYTGHAAAVRDVQFNNDGTKFLSASFDRYLRLWDVESGKVLGTYTNRRVPYVVKFYPHDDNTFVVGCSDNKIVAYDATTGEITQEYDHHLAAVNTITFVEDNGTKMVTSSDDKKVLVWEWDIGVPIKYISDPTMHSMPVVTMHPSLRYLVCQSLDNRICVFQAGDRYAAQRKKNFRGHNTAGYACDISCSPDGRFVTSGDSGGRVFFWDFKRSRVLQKYAAHAKGPAIGTAWHPVEPSTVFTCGWDGVIKMWQ